MNVARLLHVLAVASLALADNDCGEVEISRYTSHLPGSTPLHMLTLLGSHNAGAYTSSSTLPFIFDCYVRNQEVNFLGQLEKGARYLDIDVCYKRGLLVFCHGQEPWDYWHSHFFDPLEDGLSHVKCFLEKNKNEVIYLHFNRDFHVFGSPITKQIAVRMLYAKLEILKDFIFPLEEFMNTNSRLPTLDEARKSGKTVFILGADKIYDKRRYAPVRQRKWIASERKLLSILWLALPVERRDGDLVVTDPKTNFVRRRCRWNRGRLVDLQVIPDRDLTGCGDSLADAFQKSTIIQDSVEKCAKSRCMGGGWGVNFVTVDYVERLPRHIVDKIYNTTCADV